MPLFKNYLNTCHANIKFISECETNNEMPFLDFLFTRKEGKLASSVYRKPSFTGVYTNFNSLIPQTYKLGLVYTLMHRIYNICSNYELIIGEINKLKTILKCNNYPSNVIDKCIYIFRNKINIVKKEVATVEKKRLFILLPYLGKYSFEVKKKLHKLIKHSLPFCNIRITFKCQNRLSNYFRFKDRIPTSLLSHKVYFFTCAGCNSCSYYGIAERHNKIRYCDHLGKSWRTGKNIVGLQTEIRDHLNTCKTEATLDDFKIVSSDNNPFRLKIKESLFIKKDRTILNKNVYSTPLHLF